MLAGGMPADLPYDGVRPLFLAAQGITPDLIDLLIGAGADPNGMTEGHSGHYRWLRTALNAAAGADVPRYECVERLLDYGANPCLPDDLGRNAAQVLLGNASFNGVIDEMPRVNHILERMLDLGVLANCSADGKPLLHCAAISAGLPAGVRLLLSRGADPLAKDADGWNALDRACLHGRAGAAELLIQAGADVRRVKPGNPLLHMVQNIATLDVLLAAGAELEARDEKGQTALAETLSGWKWADWPDEPESPTKALRLIAAGASLDTPDMNGLTARDIITRDGIPEVIDMETAHKARTANPPTEPSAVSEAVPAPAPALAPATGRMPTAGDRRALQKAILGNNVDKVRSLLAGGMRPDVAHGGVPPLFLAASCRRPEIIDMLVEAGADPNRVLVGRASDEGPVRTALNAASAYARLENVNRLLDHGANPMLVDDEKRNAAHLLVRASDWAWRMKELPQLLVTLKRMLDLGVPVDAADGTGQTLLHYAVRTHMPVEGLELLVARGADPVGVDHEGSTPLEGASFGPNPRAISFLIGAGADVNRPRPNGVPILHWIHDEDNLDAFLAAAVDLEAKNPQGRTALFAALDGWKYSDYPDDPLPPWKARRLIAAGANPDTPDENGVTPRDLIIRDCIPIELPAKINHSR